MSEKNYEDFLSRLRENESLLRAMKVNFKQNFEELEYDFQMQADGRIRIELSTSLPGASIFYTLNGGEPTPESHEYFNPIFIKESGTFKARIYQGDETYSRTLIQDFDFHKAIAKKVEIISGNPQGNFNPETDFLLTNGVRGNHRFNDKQWMRFLGEDFEGVIDLGKVEKISEIGVGILKLHWQKMWEPKELYIFRFFR